jgi:hypothetical protein
MDLVRQILLAIEAHPGPALDTQPTITNVHRDVVTYHLEIMQEAGLIKVLHTYPGANQTLLLGIRLRWPGHEFLSVARDDTRWNKAKARLGGAIGDITLKILQDVLVSLAKSAAGLQ